LPFPGQAVAYMAFAKGHQVVCLLSGARTQLRVPAHDPV
jgi:hypothetical protein